jgi:hypothetical protein
LHIVQNILTDISKLVSSTITPNDVLPSICFQEHGSLVNTSSSSIADASSAESDGEDEEEAMAKNGLLVHVQKMPAQLLIPLQSIRINPLASVLVLPELLRSNPKCFY